MTAPRRPRAAGPTGAKTPSPAAAGPTGAETPSSAAPPPRAAEPPFSEAAIRAATGRGWDDWLRILDARGLEGFSHRDTAAWLEAEHGVTGWWAQSITVGFERARGLRAVHQTSEGFSVGISKTIPVPADRLWAAFADEESRSRWLEPGLLSLRTAQPGRTARFDVADGPSRVVVGLTPKGASKTTVAVQHERLRSSDDVEARRVFWRERLAALVALLAGDDPPGG